MVLTVMLVRASSQREAGGGSGAKAERIRIPHASRACKLASKTLCMHYAHFALCLLFLVGQNTVVV